jgi:hypothetical protein
VKARQGRRRKQLLDDLEEKRRSWRLKEETLDGTVWTTRLARGCGPVGKADCRINELGQKQWTYFLIPE